MASKPTKQTSKSKPSQKQQPPITTKNTPTKTPTTTPTTKTPTTITWPPLHPLHSPLDLTLHPLLESQILTIKNFFTPTLCATLIRFLRTLPLVTTPGRPKRGDAVRVNDRFQVDAPEFAGRLWGETGLRELVLGLGFGGGSDGEGDGEEGDEDGHGGRGGGGEGDGKDKETKEARERRLRTERRNLWGGDEVLGLNPNIRVYRYSEGMFFDRHYDDSNNVAFPLAAPTSTSSTSSAASSATSSTPSATATKSAETKTAATAKTKPKTVQAKTTWTLLIYLSACAKGGETIFYPDPPPPSSKKTRQQQAAPPPIIAAPEVGLALLHRHGGECMLHEGREVIRGEKWVLRSDLCVRR